MPPSPSFQRTLFRRFFCLRVYVTPSSTNATRRNRSPGVGNHARLLFRDNPVIIARDGRPVNRTPGANGGHIFGTTDHVLSCRRRLPVLSQNRKRRFVRRYKRRALRKREQYPRPDVVAYSRTFHFPTADGSVTFRCFPRTRLLATGLFPS